MRLAINGYFWNKSNTGSGQYTRQLVTYLQQEVSDLQIVIVFPRAIGEASAEDVPSGVEVLEKPIRSGHLGKVAFEQTGFPRACRETGAAIAHIPYWGAPLQSPVPSVVTIHDVTTLMVREYRRGEKVTAIPLAAGPGFRPEANSLVETATRQKYGLPDSYILYLGGYEIHKNVETLLEAYTYVSEALGEDYPLVLAGQKPEKASSRFPDYDSLIERLELTDKVVWAGYIEETDKPAVYRGASTFVFLSRYEGFGLPPLEAMACGVPVVTSSASSLPEVIGDAGFGLDPDDPRQIGGSIIATIVQEELAAELREKGLKRAAEFSTDRR
jgi:glycosyltransferase involved in cell wall biosynthesis